MPHLSGVKRHKRGVIQQHLHVVKPDSDLHVLVFNCLESAPSLGIDVWH